MSSATVDTTTPTQPAPATVNVAVAVQPDAPATPDVQVTVTSDEAEAKPDTAGETVDDDHNDAADEEEPAVSKPTKAKKSSNEKKKTKKDAAETKADKNASYVDENNIRVPRRRIKLSRLFNVWATKHGEPVDITKEAPMCLTHFSPTAVARIFMVRKLREDGKVTGRRDVFMQERDVNDIKTYGYVVTRRRNDEVKSVDFKTTKKDAKRAKFSINSTQKYQFLNRKNMKSFRQQIMSRAGLSQEEIDAVKTDSESTTKDKEGNLIVESDMDSGEDMPANPTQNELVDSDDDDDEKDKVVNQIDNAAATPATPAAAEPAAST